MVPCEGNYVLKYSLSLLDDLRAFVEKTNEAIYRAPNPGTGGSIGAHVRHCLEHFTSFLEGESEGCIDYDLRQRDPALESSPHAAIEKIRAIQSSLHARFSEGRLSEIVRLRGAVDAGGACRFEVESSAGRELHYVAFHALHHMAMLSLLASRHSIEVGGHFGKAPATVAFEMAQG